VLSFIIFSTLWVAKGMIPCMKGKFKIEVVLSTFLTFAIVIIAPMILVHISNEIVKMITRPLAYV
jgi:hypothetical protein